MKYDVNYFIKKFSAIPEELWCVYDRHNRMGQKCAHGHCDQHDHGYSDEENALRVIAIANPVIMEDAKGFAFINNGINKLYQQSTPKKRILAALRDIKKAQDDHMVVSEVKERIVYVTVDKEVRELQKTELSLQ